ncbi:MAG: glycosyltransferase family 4 protein [Bacteroidota bacterium]
MHLLYVQQLLILPGMRGNPRCWQFASQWQRAGHQISFLTSTANWPAEILAQAEKRQGYHFLCVAGINLYALPVAYQHEMPFWRRILSWLRFFFRAKRISHHLPKADALLAYSAPLSVGELGRQLAKNWQIPFYFEVADVWPDVPMGMGVIPKGRLAKWLIQRTNRIYAESEKIFPYSVDMARQIVAHGVSESDIQISPNGVNLEQLAFHPRKAHPGPVRLIYTGTIGRANDLSQIIRAMHWIEQQAPGLAELTIIGGGNDQERVQRLAAELGGKSVEFRRACSREEATEALASADIGLLSFAPYEVLQANSATKFFDYLASGLPIAINYEGWQARLLQEHACGISAPIGEWQVFAQRLLHLIQQPNQWEEMGERGRALAEAKFDRRKLAEKMLEALVVKETI